MTQSFKVDYHFDSDTCRHYMNGASTVLHCHHFMTLYTQLACDAVNFDGEKHLKQAAEHTFYEILQNYFSQHQLTQLEDKIAVAEQYWQTVGMGKLMFKEVGEYILRVEMPYSHIDEGWLKKWGQSNTPVNFITCGFIAAMAALFNHAPQESYEVQEIASLANGNDMSCFKALLK